MNFSFLKTIAANALKFERMLQGSLKHKFKNILVFINLLLYLGFVLFSYYFILSI